MVIVSFPTMWSDIPVKDPYNFKTQGRIHDTFCLFQDLFGETDLRSGRRLLVCVCIYIIRTYLLVLLLLYLYLLCYMLFITYLLL